MSDKGGTACHIGAFCFFIEDIFFIFAEMDYNPIFSGTVFVSVFVHLFVLSGYNDDFDIYNAVSGKVFKAKMGSPAAAWDTAFLQIRGSGGYALCKQKHSDSHMGKDEGLPACVYTQAVLAILVQTARREFACCASLGERLTTHKGVTARLL